MCGIFGLVGDKQRFTPEVLQKALTILAHRGPDSFGLTSIELGQNRVCWLGHRRLSILDLSSVAHQPMSKTLDQGICSLVYNGEIYNHRPLRAELAKDWDFKSTSDTEVLLAGLMRQGESFIPRLNSMMAFAFVDSFQQKLLLARDRLGKKPLYVYQADGVFAFASELKVFSALDLRLTENKEALAYYRWLGYVPAEMTIYEECSKFPAASFAKVDLADTVRPLKPLLFWDPLRGYAQQYKGSYEDAMEQFSDLLNDATKIRLDADVPVGVFLSGGIDSSLVASSVAALHSRDVEAFTVRFKDPAFDESEVAIDTAKQLGIRIHLLDLDSTDFDRQMEKIAFHYDEPFSDSSQIPTLAISEATKKYASVVLTGDGGDEVFLGYPRFSNQARLARYQRLIRSIPGLSATMVAFFSSGLGQKIFANILTWSGMGGSQTNLDSKIARLKSLLSLDDISFIYESVMCVQQKDWLSKDLQNRLGAKSLRATIHSWYPGYGWDALLDRSLEEQLAAMDLVTYMRDDVLVKVDRATMAYSLEARSPLLDYRIVEFGTSLPKHYKLKGQKHKRLLRDVLAKRLRGDIVHLGKKGFGVPLPEALPAGPTMAARWNTHVENQWRLSAEKSL